LIKLRSDPHPEQLAALLHRHSHPWNPRPAAQPTVMQARQAERSAVCSTNCVSCHTRSDRCSAAMPPESRGFPRFRLYATLDAPCHMREPHRKSRVTSIKTPVTQGESTVTRQLYPVTGDTSSR
jgi:hypothetical protein